MKIAIVSDIHDNQVNLKKCLDWLKKGKFKEMIYCGDITNNETLDILAKGFPGKIYLVKGNAEIYQEEDLEKYKNIEYGGKVGIFNVGGKIVGICHEPFLIDSILEKERVDIIFHGHTHRPWIREKEKTRIINPGTLGAMFMRATFGIWDSETGKLELKILDEL